MSKIRVTMFALLLAGGVIAAVAGPMAQATRAPERDERSRPRVMMLEGRGAQLGVMVADLDDAALKAAGARGGVRIEDVDQDGPAAKAGLREGDLVIDVDGEGVRSARQFSRVIQETPPGRSVSLGVLRDGQRQTIAVTPETRALGFGVDGDRIGRDIARGLREGEPRLREIEPYLREFRFNGPLNFDFDVWANRSNPRGRLGVQLGELTPQLAEYFGAADGGVLISGVSKGSPAEKAGLKAGDVITSINGDRVRDSDDLIDELRDAEGSEVTLGILRDKNESTVTATIESRARPAMRRPV